MGKIVDFESGITVEDVGEVFIENTPEMKAFGLKVADAMGTLGLSAAQVKGLTDPIMAYVDRSRKDAFKQGFSMGVAIGRDLGGGDDTA